MRRAIPSLAFLDGAARSGIAAAAGLPRGRQRKAPEPELIEPDLAEAVFLPLAGAGGALVLLADDPIRAAARRRYRDLVEASSDFIWETDRLGRFVFCRSRTAFGHPARDLLGRNAAEYVVDASPLPYPAFQARRRWSQSMSGCSGRTGRSAAVDHGDPVP